MVEGPGGSAVTARAWGGLGVWSVRWLRPSVICFFIVVCYMYGFGYPRLSVHWAAFEKYIGTGDPVTRYILGGLGLLRL